MSIRAMASALGVSPSTVMRDLKQRSSYQPDQDGRIAVGKCTGTDGKVRPDRWVDTTERDARINDLYFEGQTMRAIAGEVGCSVGTVHRVLNS